MRKKLCDLNIGILTIGDPRNVRTWSGTPYFMIRELERRGASLTCLGPMPQLPRKMLKVLEKAAPIITKKRYESGSFEPLPTIYARTAEHRISKARPELDLIFVIASSTALYKLRSDLPVAYCSDATVQLMLDYYPGFSALHRASLNAAERAEQAAITRADLLIYPTQWVAKSAVEDYCADPDQIRIIPFGANLDDTDLPEESLPTKDDTVCRLLMVGADWRLKGGDIAVRAFRILRERGVRVEMHIIGSTPPTPVECEGLHVIPFLNKKDPTDKATFIRLYREASIFMLPTRAECFGIVFNEAAAFGLPVVCTATGGTPDVVLDGVTGITVPPEGDAEEFADAVEAIWNDPQRYAEYRRASRERFLNVGNWEAWGEAFEDALQPLLKR